MRANKNLPRGLVAPEGLNEEARSPERGAGQISTSPDADQDIRDGNLSSGEPLSSTDFFGLGTMRNPVEFREWFKIMFRVWRPAMSPNQFLTALFVFDRTAAWGKEWEIITHRQFLTGVYGRDGREYAAGLRMTTPTLIAALDWLKAAGAILTKPATARRTAYALNLTWNPNQIPPDMMPTPKRLQTVQTRQTDPEGKTILPTEGKTILPYKERKGKCEAEQRGIACPGAGAREGTPSVADTLASVSERSRKQRDARKRGMGADAIALVWADTCRSAFPESSHLAVTKTDSAILRKYALRWLAADPSRTAERWSAYLRWVIGSWLAIRSHSFAWMKAASPGVPSIRFLVKFSDRFEAAWIDRERVARLGSLTPVEREVEGLVSRGMDRERAERVVRERIDSATAAPRPARRAGRSASNDDAGERNRRWADLSKRTGATFDPWE